MCERHPDLPGGRYVVSDARQVEASHGLAATRWREKFGEPLPPASRAGRPTAVSSARTERVELRLTSDELAVLDRLRGSRSRSEYLRSQVGQAARLMRRFDESDLVKSVFLAGADGRWELSIVRPRGVRPRSLTVEGRSLQDVEEKALVALLRLPDDVSWRLSDVGVDWTRTGEPWRCRSGALDEAFGRRLRAEAQHRPPATDTQHLPQTLPKAA